MHRQNLDQTRTGLGGYVSEPPIGCALGERIDLLSRHDRRVFLNDSMHRTIGALFAQDASRQAHGYSLSPFRTANFAFPNCQHVPSRQPQSPCVSPVAPDVRVELFLPELRVGFRIGCNRAPRMTVPEAAVDEHDCSPLRQYDVRSTRKVPRVQAITKTELVERFADGELRCCVLPAYLAHPLGALLACERINHG